jgi:hypothetical protein
MSLLYPLFLAGITALALPIVLHMIRRHTRHRVTFSSLMFLRETLPRFQSRSRLEHVPLLILRCAALCLLAFAFARPFFVRAVATSPVRADKRMVLLLDTSASMRRARIWTRAIDEAKSVLADAGPADRVCVMSFDEATRTLMGFDQWTALEPAQRAAVAGQELSQLSPGWAPTNLGHALVTAAEAMEEDEVNDGRQPVGTRRIVLISDLQQGSRLEALLAYEWPKQTELMVKTIPCQGTTNASLQLVTSRDPVAPSHRSDLPSIRVTSSPDATKDRFQLSWADEARTNASSRTLDVYVPAGHSAVVQAPLEPNRPAAGRLVLTGDDHDFDNTLYLAPHRQKQVNILYLGADDPNDPAEMLYYVRRALGTGRAATARVVRHPGGESVSVPDIETADWVIVADAPSPQNLTALRRHVESGKSLLLVMQSEEAAAALSGLAGIRELKVQEADAGRYAMLGRMEFDHPLLKPFSDPRFGDFTRIHFWKHRRVDITGCPGARVLAWFDNDDPAWFEVPVGRGSLLVWTSGWHPADSDLALSSKFVPLLYCALESGGTLAERRSQYFVGDSVPLPNPASAKATNFEVRKPDGSAVRLQAGQQTFAQTDLPGIYSISASAPGDDAQSPIRDSQLFAINLPAGESRTEVMSLEDLEKLGIPLKPTAGVLYEAAEGLGHPTSLTEMESEQKLWRWILLSMLLVLLIETALAGWLTRPAPVPEGEPS